jgi:hypothetical protein
LTSAFPEARLLKTLGYSISSISVLCLGLVAWDGAKDKPLMMALLIVGMATSVIGMAARWASFAREQRAKGKAPTEMEGPRRQTPRGAQAQTRISK